jgi:hypothetical protein
VHEQLSAQTTTWRPVNDISDRCSGTRPTEFQCSPQYWALSAQAANDDDEPAQELYDIDKFARRAPERGQESVFEGHAAYSLPVTALAAVTRRTCPEVQFNGGFEVVWGHHLIRWCPNYSP